jgi:FkbM family methyltransferase
MKSIREFIYLSKYANIFYAFFYLLYKASFKAYSFPLIRIYGTEKKKWLTKIYDHLNLLNSKTEIISGKELIIVTSHQDNFLKIYLRPFSSDLQVYSQVITQKSYQPVIEIYNQIFKTQPAQMIDLGANIGLTSIYFAKKYENLSITAVEPFKENAEIAELNMRTNNLKNFKILQGGVWNKITNLSLKRGFRDGKEWGINLAEDSYGKIKGYCLNQLLDQYYHPIDFLKIDIEGAEEKLFADQIYAAEFLKKIKCLAMEIHDEFNCRNTIYEILKENNFFYYDIQDMTIAINKKFI